MEVAVEKTVDTHHLTKPQQRDLSRPGGIEGAAPIARRGEPCLPSTVEECVAARERLATVRAQLWRMFLRHPTGIPYALAMLGFGVLLVAFWGHAQPLPHGAIMLGWGVCIVGPSAWAMARAREALYHELCAVRRELDVVERRLVRAEAERRVRIARGESRCELS